MNEIFKRRQLAEQIVLKAATTELEEVIALGVKSEHFRDEIHRGFFDNLIFRDKIKNDISKPDAHISMMQNPEGKFKTILDIYAMNISRYNVARMVEVLIEWSQFDKIKEKASSLVHRIDTWDFKEKTSVIFDMAKNVSEDETDEDEYFFTENYADEWLEGLLNPKKHKKIIDTGICYLNRKLSGGFKTTKLYTVAARTGCGKTAFATNITLSAAKQGYHCLYITLEMNRDEITNRLSSTLSCVPIEKYDNANFTDEEKLKVLQSSKEIKKLPINICSKSKGDWIKVEKIIREIKRKKQLDFVVVDYIQQYSCPSRGFKSSDKRQEIDYMTGRFKQLALELDFAAIMLAQLNRDLDKDSTDRPPRLSDIKESSSIEQDSDAVIMLFCTNQKRIDSGEEDEKIIAVKIAKNRSGNVGMENLNTKLSINKFYPL